MSHNPFHEEYDQYMGDVSKYLASTRRPIKLADPRSARFSEAAETARQAGHVDRSNYQQALDDTDSIDLEGPQNDDQDPTKGDILPDSIDLSTGQPGASTGVSKEQVKKPFHPHQIMDWVMNPLDPEASKDLLGDAPPEYKGNDPIAIIGGEIAGAAHAIGKTAIDAFSTPMTWLGMGPLPTAPKIISQAALKDMVAERTVEKALQNTTAHGTGAFPDVTGVPRTVRETGNTLVTPPLNPGEHLFPGPEDKYVRGTDYGVKVGEPGSGILKDAKGRKKTRTVKSSTSDVGEYGEGDQLSLLGGYNVRGNQSYLTGATPIGAEDQLPMGAEILRGQRMYYPEIPDAYERTVSQPITEALKTRMLSPQEERTLSTPLAEQGRYPIGVKLSESGRSASVGAAEDDRWLITLPKDLTVENTVGGAVFPSKAARAFGSELDTMKKAGPIGRAMSWLFDRAWTNRATATTMDMNGVTAELDAVLGTRGALSRKAVGAKELFDGENAFIESMVRRWNFSEKERESLFNYMYTKRQMAPMNDRVRQAGEILFEKGLYPASSDPGVRMLTITNPFKPTEKIALGEPGMFMPQQPVSRVALEGINDTHWGILYERAGGESLGVSKEQFKKTIIAIGEKDPEVTAFKMQGLEHMRLLHLDALGGSPYQWAKKLGYETDPFRAVFRYNSLARLRGNLEQIRQPVNDLLMKIPAEQRDVYKWLHLASDRAMLNPGSWDTLTTTADGLRTAGRLMDATMLQQGGYANLGQLPYLFARGGMASLKGTWNMLTGAEKEVVANSGALFQNTLNQVTHPTGALARISAGTMRLYGLSMVDRFTRLYGAHIGNEFVKGLEYKLIADPWSTKYQGFIKELGGDPAAIVAQGKIPEEMRYTMIQSFTNKVAGVSDPRGIPMWLLSEDPKVRFVNKYRSFAFANSGEIRRLVQDAPNGWVAAQRVATLVGGAAVVGGSLNMGRKAVQDFFGDDRHISKTKVQFMAENLVMGLGAVEGIFAVQALKRPEMAVGSLVGGPAAGVATGLIGDAITTYKHGVGARTFDTLAHRAPVVGPIIGPIVGKYANRQAKIDAEITRDLNDTGE